MPGCRWAPRRHAGRQLDFPNHIGYTLRHPLPEVHRASGSSGRRRGHESPPVPAPEGFTSRPSRRQGPGQTARLPIRERFPRDLWSRHLIASPRAGSEPLSLRVELDCSCAFQPFARRTRFGDPQPGRPRTPARYPSRVPTPKRSSPRRKARTRQRAYSRAYRPASGARVLCAAPGATRASPPPAPCGARRFRRGRSRSRAAPDRCLQPAMSPTSVLRAGSGKEPRGDPRPRTSRGGAFRFPAGPAPIPHSQAP